MLVGQQPDRAWPCGLVVTKSLEWLRALNREALLTMESSLFDRWVATWIMRCGAAAAVGYEQACLATFHGAEAAGMVRILDHASVHWRTQLSIVREDRELRGTLGAGWRRSLRRAVGRKSAELALANIVLTPSTYSRRTLIEGGVPANKIRMIPYGVDSDFWSPDQADGRARDERRAVFVGHGGVHKGLSDLLDAWRLVSRRGTTLHLVGHLRPAEFSRVPSNVVWEGKLRSGSLRNLLRRCHLLVLPSLSDSFGLAVVEAMACGLPVIVSERTGAADLVTPGVEGFVVPVRDVQSLARAIERLLFDPIECTRMGRNARIRAAARDWNSYARDIVALMNQVLH